MRSSWIFSGDGIRTPFLIDGLKIKGGYKRYYIDNLKNISRASSGILPAVYSAVAIIAGDPKIFTTDP
jgi:hypothetical protein